MLRSLIGAAMLLALSSQAHALTCMDIRKAIRQHGEPMVILWALNHGYTEADIARIKQLCRLEKV